MESRRMSDTIDAKKSSTKETVKNKEQPSDKICNGVISIITRYMNMEDLPREDVTNHSSGEGSTISIDTGKYGYKLTLLQNESTNVYEITYVDSMGVECVIHSEETKGQKPGERSITIMRNGESVQSHVVGKEEDDNGIWIDKIGIPVIIDLINYANNISV